MPGTIHCLLFTISDMLIQKRKRLTNKKLNLSIPFRPPAPLQKNIVHIKPFAHGGGALKISLGNPYLKILDLAKLFIADAPMKKNSKKLVLPPLRAL